MRMRTLLLLAALLAIGLGTAAAHAQPVEVNMSVFFDTLAPYGNWAYTAEYGWVWSPANVPEGWRPYSDGHWAYTEVGWTWVSDYDWGWAPFHYGRWYYDADWGWRWVPGYEWSPAWVAWHEGGGWVGWAPLPPTVAWSGAALRFGGPHWAVEIDPTWFAFVEMRYLLAPRVYSYFAPPQRNVTLVQQTVNITNYTIVNNTIVSNALPVERVERVVGHPVPRLRVIAAPQAERTRQQVRGDELVIFRPAISRANPAHVPTVTAVPPKRHVATGVIGGATVTHPATPSGAPHAAPHVGSTPLPHATPHPSVMQREVVTPHPTATPHATATPHPAPKPYVAPEPVKSPTPRVIAKPVASPTPHPSPKASPTPHASPTPPAMKPAVAVAKPTPTPTPAKTPVKAKEKPKTDEDDHKPPAV